MSVRDTSVSSVEALNFAGTVETELNEKLSMGVEYEQSRARFKPRAVFALWRSKEGEGDPLKVKTTYNVAANSAGLELSYSRAGFDMDVTMDTARSKWLKRLGFSRRLDFKGRALTLSPEFDMETTTTTLTSTLSVNEDTDLRMVFKTDDLADRDALDATLELQHNIDAENSIKPTFDLNTGDVTYQYKRTPASGDASLEVNVLPGKEVKLEWKDTVSAGVWTTNVRVPWGEPEDSSLSMKRTFCF